MGDISHVDCLACHSRGSTCAVADFAAAGCDVQPGVNKPLLPTHQLWPDVTHWSLVMLRGSDPLLLLPQCSFVLLPRLLCEADADLPGSLVAKWP